MPLPAPRHPMSHVGPARRQGPRRLPCPDATIRGLFRRGQPLLAAHREHFELLFLPPYSPQLAPIERVWRLTRRLATHNLHFNSLDELVAAVESPFNQWRKPNKVSYGRKWVTT